MKTVAEVLDPTVKDYDGWFDTPKGKLLFNMEVDAVKRLVGKMNHPFLEIGVGTGRFAGEIGIDFGRDPSLEALRMAKKRGIQVKQARGEKLPFEEATYGWLKAGAGFICIPAKKASEGIIVGEDKNKDA